MNNEFRMFGAPGCGKTTALSKEITEAAEKYGSEAIFVASFTRTAAEELAGRKLPLTRHQVNTLHGHCYHVLGSPELVDSKEFSMLHPHYAISADTSKNAMDENVIDAQTGETEGDALFSEYNILRNKMIPREKWSLAVQDFAKVWEDFKKETDSIDFTDMIELAYQDVEEAPGHPTVGFFDETQDFTMLELSLIRKWGKKMEKFWLAGDDDQCQPAGTKVLTINGYKAIEDLEIGTDKIVSYDRAGSSVVGLKNGYEFQKAEREYKGNLFTVQTGDKETKCTDNHLWLAKWNEEAKKENVTCVYLMKQGSRYRIGWTQLFRNDGCFHLGVRARLENADSAWILRVFDNKKDASIYESAVSSVFGIPLIPFEPKDNSYFTKNAIDNVFYLIESAGINLEERAAELLENHGLQLEYPMWHPDYINRGGSSIMKIRACNLIDGLMMVPVHQGGKVATWENISVTREQWEGKVYSLNVEKHHTYIANGIITHNCLYNFKGATSAAFLDGEVPPENVHILNQSHRVPQTIQAFATNWIKQIGHRQEKEYKPKAGEPGSIERLRYNYKQADYIIEDARKHLEAGKKVMFLTSCSHMLFPIVSSLRAFGLLFHNPYRYSRGDWNPVRRGGKGTTATERLYNFLLPSNEHFREKAKMWNAEEFYKWIEPMTVKGNLKKGAKQNVKALSAHFDFDLTVENLMQYLEDEALMKAMDHDLEWYISTLTKAKKKSFEFPVRIIQEQGMDALLSEPQIIVGTIHSVKGGEADVVYLFPDISRKAMQHWQSYGEEKDSIIRQFYVGATRSQEKLILCSPATGCYIDMEYFR